ncbi:MAG: RNA degradosome polyphosphate kinase [Chloroflexi bacterium RBG_16_54_18]|nr:MAG: RNA degradosome polyphosphate kinase [Chloroflexi bacterium RBG_16_54_18]
MHAEIVVESAGDSPVDLKEPQYYINRELSLLEFQRRVLEEAQDEHNPLLERAKFLAILGSNLDEFFMVRVSGLKKQIDAGVVDLPPDGMTPAQQLADIRKLAHLLMSQARECLHNDLQPRLKQAGIHILSYQELNERQKTIVNNYFEEVVFPVLTPLAFDPGHPFPHISNLSLNLAVVIRDQDGRELFARVKVPDSLPRLVPLKKSSGSTRKDGTIPSNHYFVWLEQVIGENLDRLFPGMEIIEAHPFRVTRDADMMIQEMEASDLLETMELSVRQRRFGNVVRVTVEEGMPTRIREILIENLEMDRRDIYTVDAPLGLGDLMSLHSLDRYDLKDPPFKPALPQPLRSESQDGNLLAVIRREDILLHHPYNSFKPVEEFLRIAARDPDVLAIKQTLYRVGRNSPVVQALLEARENGKQVAVLVELKARFDEESNIGWARTLEKEGVHVIYGLLGLKTHSKVALVVRKEGENIRRYVHLATGNYNAITAQVYEDIGMFTCDEDIGADSTDLFNYLTGYSAIRDYRKLLVAPINLRQGMVALIDREIEHQRRSGNGHLIFKMNSLVDPPMIRKLYRASQAGVKIDLLVRGMCCLRAGIPNVSDNIHVLSVVGRFLEHSRIYYFHNDGQEQIYLGSADLMPRNINHRVEVLFPVQDIRLVQHLRNEVFGTYFKANVKVREMTEDGQYRFITPKPDEKLVNPQEWLINLYQKI